MSDAFETPVALPETNIIKFPTLTAQETARLALTRPDAPEEHMAEIVYLPTYKQELYCRDVLPGIKQREAADRARLVQDAERDGIDPYA